MVHSSEIGYNQTMRFLMLSLSNTLGWLLIVVLSTVTGTTSLAQTFTDVDADLTGVLGCAVAWCDYDNDGDLDILLTGEHAPFEMLTKIYRNDGNEVFTDINADVPGVSLGSVAWGDYDNDGDPDLLISGQIAPYVPVTLLYRNDGSSAFTNINTDLPGLFTSSVAWGDYDNDGDLDIALSGASASGNITKVYRNDGDGVFADIHAHLPGVEWSAVAWGDYDNDHDLDILLTGQVNSDHRVSVIYRNDANGVFTDITAGLIGVSHGSVAWGDYDSDGDLDILLTGTYGMYNSDTVSKIYRNDGDEAFSDISADLVDVGFGSAVWGDYDNDGDFDVLLTGWKNMAGEHTIVYRNDENGVFVDINDGLVAVSDPSVAWGDYDNDGDLDFLLAGQEYWTGPMTAVFRNDGGFAANELPSSPVGLDETIYDDSVVLSWHRAADNETQSPSVTYNLRMGTSPEGVDIVSPMANHTGYRQIVALGSANHDTTWTIKDLPEGTYYWSVQAVDNAFAGSDFAVEGSFSIMDTGSGPESDLDLRQYVLFQNHPNPFNPVTTIAYDVPYASYVQLVIYDAFGARTAVLVDAFQAAGHHRVRWDGTDQLGNHLASGAYVCRLDADQVTLSKKMLLIK